MEGTISFFVICAVVVMLYIINLNTKHEGKMKQLERELKEEAKKSYDFNMDWYEKSIAEKNKEIERLKGLLNDFEYKF